MDLFGRGYVLDHVLAQFQAEQRNKAYQKYIADLLQLIGENVAKTVIGGGTYIPQRWDETPQPIDDRTGDEIALDIIKRAGLIIGGE